MHFLFTMFEELFRSKQICTHLEDTQLRPFVRHLLHDLAPPQAMADLTLLTHFAKASSRQALLF